MKGGQNRTHLSYLLWFEFCSERPREVERLDGLHSRDGLTPKSDAFYMGINRKGGTAQPYKHRSEFEMLNKSRNLYASHADVRHEKGRCKKIPTC